MIKNILLLPDQFGKIDSTLQEKIVSNFKKFGEISTFSIVGDDGVFSKEKAQKLLENGEEKEFITEILKKAKSFNTDFVLIKGCENLAIFNAIDLNIKIALNLNAAILLKDCEFAKTIKNLASNSNINSFIINNENIEEIAKKLQNYDQNIITPYAFETMLYETAKSDIKNVVLPESFDDRILKAADIILKSKAVKITLLGKKEEIKKRAKDLNLNLDEAIILDNQTDERLENFANTLYELRKEKGMTLEKAQILVKDKTYFATMMVYLNEADAMVSGASTTTAETIRPALQTIKMKKGVSTVSGSFLMCMKDKIWIFADCAITPNPTTDQLAGIALSSAKTAASFGINPKIAMLSYSTGESGSGEDVDFVKEALQKAKEICTDYEIDGPLQFDASVDKIVADKKMPNSKVAGEANVFIFPNLNCGNICYKAVQRSSGAVAIGPILQGLKKPVNDLSRGCLVEDIVNTILISAIQAKDN